MPSALSKGHMVCHAIESFFVKNGVDTIELKDSS